MGLLNFAKQLPSKTQNPTMAVNGLQEILKAYSENKRVQATEKTKRQEIQALRDVEIEKIKAQKEIIKDYLDKSFSERKDNFSKMFEILDKGLETNNIDVVMQSLGAIVEVSKQSPLSGIKELVNDYSNPSVKEIEI